MQFNSRIGLILLLCIPLYAPAAVSDRQQTLEINADHGEFGAGDGINEIWGNVEIKQGTLLITAERAKAHIRNKRVYRVELTGAPVHWEQLVDGQGKMEANANYIDYRIDQATLTLRRQVFVKHPQGELRGESVDYDLRQERLTGNGSSGDDGRVRILLNPEVTTPTPDSANQDSQDP